MINPISILLKRFLICLVITPIIIISGTLFPALASVLISSLTEATFQECTTTVAFWIITIIGIIISAVYFIDTIKANYEKEK